jgi:hypothetical protein
MRTILKSDFFWQFLGGFAIGAIGLAGVHLADTGSAPVEASAPITTIN